MNQSEALPAPSNQWVAVALAGTSVQFWVWNFPPTAPQTIAIKLPWSQFAAANVQVSVFGLLQSLRLSNSMIQSVQVGGNAYSSQADFLLTPQMTGPDGLVNLFVSAPQPVGQPVFQAPLQMQPHAGAAGPIDESAYKRADADWKSTLYLETQASGLRKTLAGTQARLGGLNKDLSPEERRFASRQDLADWNDARRFLRDAAARISRYIKEYDIGLTSSAGRRNWMESMYVQYIKTRQPFSQMEQMQREFEVYRKLLQNLVNNMTTVNAFAQQEGEQRAKQVLARVRASARRNKTKDRK